MRRRGVLWLMAGGLVAGCGPRRVEAVPAASASASPAARLAVADDYRWFAGERDLAKGFCFTWALEVMPGQVIERLGAKELERIRWRQLVGAGDGQRGFDDRYFVGVARVGRWSMIVEDNGSFGVADELLGELSVGSTVVSHYRAADGHGRVLVVSDRRVELDIDPQRSLGAAGQRLGEMGDLLRSVGFGAAKTAEERTAAAFALVERVTMVAMTAAMLDEKTYILATVPKGRKSQ